MEVIIAFMIAISMFTEFHPLKKQPQQQINIDIGISHAHKITYDVKPLSEFKNENVVKQMYDFSCGSAALATILNFQFGEKFEERQVIQGLLKYGDKEKIEKRRAFSLLDMKKFVRVLGYKGVGYKAETEDLLTLKEPGIIPLEILGYRHFVVFRGIYDKHVFIADPSQGNISFTLNRFEEMWAEKIIFIVYSQNGIKNEHENKWHALKLSDKDLRYVDYDFTRKFAFQDRAPFNIRIEEELMEQGGKYLFHKPR